MHFKTTDQIGKDPTLEIQRPTAAGVQRIRMVREKINVISVAGLAVGIGLQNVGKRVGEADEFTIDVAKTLADSMSIGLVEAEDISEKVAKLVESLTSTVAKYIVGVSPGLFTVGGEDKRWKDLDDRQRADIVGMFPDVFFVPVLDFLDPPAEEDTKKKLETEPSESEDLEGSPSKSTPSSSQSKDSGQPGIEEE